MVDKKVEDYLKRAMNVGNNVFNGAGSTDGARAVTLEIAKMIQLEEHRNPTIREYPQMIPTYQEDMAKHRKERDEIDMQRRQPLSIKLKK